MNISETKWRRTADRKEERDVEEMTEEGSMFQMGTVWQRKDDKWRDDEADGKRKEWGKRVDRSCAQGTSEACNAGGPFPIESCQRRPRQCSRLRHDKVGRRACWRVDTSCKVVFRTIALATRSWTFSTSFSKAGDAPHHTALQYSRRGRINATKKRWMAIPCILWRKARVRHRWT